MPDNWAVFPSRGIDADLQRNCNFSNCFVELCVCQVVEQMDHLQSLQPVLPDCLGCLFHEKWIFDL